MKSEMYGDDNTEFDRLARERLAESAKLYAEVYAEDEELRKLTEEALEDWFD